MAVAYEPFSPRWREDPYPAFRELRESAPVHYATESKCYCVARHADVLAVLEDPETFSSRAMFTMLMSAGEEKPPPLDWRAIKFLGRFAWHTRMNPLGFATARNLIASDPPVHATLRAIVNRGFTPRRIRAWEQRIREIVDQRLRELGSACAFDVVHELAIPLPVTIIAEMLGVEAERQADFKRWSDAAIEGMTGARRRPFPPEDDIATAFIELDAYLARVVRARRRRPGDDLVSAILESEPGGARLSSMEVIQFVMLLLVAGNETTTNLIGNAVSALLDHPRELARVREDPALVPELVEEVLRWDAPIQMVFRNATRDAEIAGTKIPKGAMLALLLGSANRDERRFANAEAFDVGRDTRGHLAFGFGNHFCLGASLARLEARIALEALVPHLARFERAGASAFLDSFLVRGRSRLELRPAA
jgi:cytochrome P450